MNDQTVARHTVPDEDIELFAKGLYRARGIAAHGLAVDRAKGLREAGDLEGHKIWQDVADRVTKFRGRPAS